MASLREAPQVIVSTVDARGGEGPEAGTIGDTLVPMLISVLGLTLVGVIAALAITVF
ncbi:MAG: hypothetical protein KIS68_05980 [Bauldia sp.]|nr:hypothetical protein [Bauldia sp.]